MNIANFGKSAVLVGVAVAMCVTATPPASAAPIEASIALGFGDSFGDGTPKSGIPNLLGCQRQDYRTDVIVAERLGMTSRNVACAGATIKQIMEGYKGEPSQLDAITDDVKVLLVSAGGNDAVGPTTTAACMVPIECTESNPIIKKGWKASSRCGTQSPILVSWGSCTGQSPNALRRVCWSTVTRSESKNSQAVAWSHLAAR